MMEQQIQQQVITSEQIKRMLLREFRRGGHMPVATEISLPHHFIADVATVKKSTGFVYEFEIKTSYQDFKADFQKTWKGFYSNGFAKHDAMRNRRHGNTLPTNEYYLKWTTQPEPDKVWNPNYFFFVAPKGIIPVSEVPEYAGLIEVWHEPQGSGSYLAYHHKKKGKRLHNEKEGNNEHIRTAFLNRLSNVLAFGTEYKEDQYGE